MDAIGAALGLPSGGIVHAPSGARRKRLAAGRHRMKEQLDWQALKDRFARALHDLWQRAAEGPRMTSAGRSDERDEGPLEH